MLNQHYSLVVFKGVLLLLSFILRLLIPGVCLGCVYGLNGIGSALLYKGSHTINNAQGAVVGFGALLGYHLQQGLKMGLIASPSWSWFVSLSECFCRYVSSIRSKKGHPCMS